MKDLLHRKSDDPTSPPERPRYSSVLHFPDHVGCGDWPCWRSRGLVLNMNIKGRPSSEPASGLLADVLQASPPLHRDTDGLVYAEGGSPNPGWSTVSEEADGDETLPDGPRARTISASRLRRVYGLHISGIRHLLI